MNSIGRKGQQGCAVALILACLTLSACKERPVWTITDARTGSAANGAVIYAQRCAVCHGPSGVGNELYPTLIGSAYLVDRPELAVLATSQGLYDPDSDWSEAMAPMGSQISDVMLSAVVTYLRSLSGVADEDAPIDTSFVRQWRVDYADRDGTWTHAELQAVPLPAD